MYKNLILATFILIGTYFYTLKSEKPVDDDIYFIRANNAFANEKYDLAKDYYLKDFEQNPSQARSLSNLSVSFLKGSAKSLSLVIEYYTKLINHPEFTLYVNQPLILNFNKLGMMSELRQITGIVKSNFLLGQIYFFVDLEKAAMHMAEVSDSKKDVNYLFLYGQISFNLGNYKEAIQHLDSAIKLGNMNSKLYYLKSQSLLRIRNIEASIQVNKIYQTLLSFEQNTKTATEQLDEMRVLLKNHTELRNIKEYQYQLLTLLLYNNIKGEATNLINNLELSEVSNQFRINIVSAAIKSRNVKVLNDMYNSAAINKISASEAILYCQSQKDIIDKKSIQMFCLEATNKFEDSAAIHFWYGIMLLNENKTEEAIKKMKKAINYAPWMDEWRIHLAQLYLTLGQTKQAFNVIDQSISEYRVHLEQFKLQNGLINNEN